MKTIKEEIDFFRDAEVAKLQDEITNLKKALSDARDCLKQYARYKDINIINTTFNQEFTNMVRMDSVVINDFGREAIICIEFLDTMLSDREKLK